MYTKRGGTTPNLRSKACLEKYATAQHELRKVMVM
jgi:hypothetical protein